MAANPSHLLISRNPRSPAHPQLASTVTSSPYLFPFPTDDSTLPHANERSIPSRHMRSQSTPAFDLDIEDETEPLEIHPTFRKDAEFPGRVLVIVGGYEFWCHKEVLWFASPFFNALLKGPWTETGGKGHGHGRSDSLIPSVSSSSQAPSSTPPDPEPAATAEQDDHGVDAVAPAPDTDTLYLPGKETKEDEQKGSVYLDAQDGPSVAEILAELRNLPEPPVGGFATEGAANRLSMLGATPSAQQPFQLSETDGERKDAKPASPLSSLSSSGVLKPKPKRASVQSSNMNTPPRPCSAPAGNRGNKDADCVVELKEESPEAFQDFLYWAYPHLDCKATWTNVEGLLALSLKLIVPSLTKLCEQFLMTHASGRPVMAISLAEQHGNAELYREASRFLLDQPTWDPEEFDSLSETTQLKLSKRRTWFLERLLKLGTIDVKKEYTCRPDCPDPSKCQTQLDEKWRQAYLAVSRYGPPQASVAFRCLRQLETFPTNPSLVMPHPLCQTSAKSWVSTLFDRMFQPKVAFGLVTPGTEKVSCLYSVD